MPPPRDIDLAALSHQRQRVEDVLMALGMRESKRDLAVPYMDRIQLMTTVTGREVGVEVFFDELAFVHRVPFVADFEMSFPTLRLETLILSKLQMRRFAFVDLVHLSAFLIQGFVESRGGTSLDLGQIAAPAERDFRCARDFGLTLSALAASVGELDCTEDERRHLLDGISAVRGALDGVRHGGLWWFGRVKARLGIEPPEPELPSAMDAS
jgi:hypothetical protein